MNASDVLDRAASALADATRRGILQRLAQGPTTAGQMANLFAISRPAVSRHVHVLEKAGLLTATYNGRHRWYEANGDNLGELEDWIRDLRKRLSEAPTIRSADS
jgi:DNA-binding transcriptional ArsR family regulator